MVAGELLADGRAIGGIDPERVVAVLLHAQLERGRLFDVDQILGVFERQRAAAIDIEVGLQFPVAR